MAVETQSASSRASWLYDAHVRAILYQLFTVACFVLLVAWLAGNTIENLDRRGIRTGFGFLDNPAGFGLPFTLIPYSETSSYGVAFIVGILNTLFISFWGIVVATLLGFLLGIARLSHNWIISKLAAVYLETLRNVPLLLQILFWYYGVLQVLPSVRQSIAVGEAFFINNRGLFMPAPILQPGFWAIPAALVLAVAASIFVGRWAKQRQERTGQQFPVLRTAALLIVGLPALAALLTGFPLEFDYPALERFTFRGGMVVIPEFLALLLALSLYTAAFIGEIVRAGIQSVSHGQTEAAYALGLRPGLTQRFVIIPQALRVIVPPLTSQYLNLTKNSSLAAAIGYPELVAVFAGTVLNQTGQALECILLTMAVYFTISLAISGFMNWYNRRIALVER